MAALEGPSWGPAAGGAPRKLVVLLHGVGADGHDLIDLSPSWGKAVPYALFLSPDAPEAYDQAPYGRQWFSLRDRSPSMLEAGVRAAASILDDWLEARMAQYRLAPSDVALMGFSQGAMTALFTGVRRDSPPAAILAYSGALLAPERLAAEIRSRPPVLLVHGEADEVVPVEASRRAESALRALDVPVETVWRPGLGHGIDDVGITLGALSLQRALSGSP